MTVLDIITPPHKTLRQKAQAVTRFDDSLQLLIDNMIETMREANGVGLAAPQINQSIQLAVIESLPELDEDGNSIPDSRELFVLVNPEISWSSPKTSFGIEGCLSIPGWLGEVERPFEIRVKAQDRYGKPIKLRLSDWTARIFQHEIDHLLGILYIDRLSAPENLWTEQEYYDTFEKDEREEDIAATD